MLLQGRKMILWSWWSQQKSRVLHLFESMINNAFDPNFVKLNVLFVDAGWGVDFTLCLLSVDMLHWTALLVFYLFCPASWNGLLTCPFSSCHILESPHRTDFVWQCDASYTHFSFCAGCFMPLAPPFLDYTFVVPDAFRNCIFHFTSLPLTVHLGNLSHLCRSMRAASRVGLYHHHSLVGCSASLQTVVARRCFRSPAVMQSEHLSWQDDLTSNCQPASDKWSIRHGFMDVSCWVTLQQSLFICSK